MVVIIGGGKFSEEVSAYFKYPIVGFDHIFDKPVKGILAIGSPRYKEICANNLKKVIWTNLKHQDARCYSKVDCEGVLILPGSIVTTNVILGDHVSINLNCTIGHDCIIGCYTTIHPGCNISGNVHIGRKCEIGTNTCIIPGVRIGDNVVIGAGSVIIRDIPDNCTVVGNPARIIKENVN